METVTKLFGSLLVFIYHCFDRMVIHGYLSGLSGPDQVVYFFQDVVGAPVVSKEVLSKRTGDFQRWVEAYAGNHEIPVEWAEKGVRKEDHVRPWLQQMEKQGRLGVYFIFKCMEQTGRRFGSVRRSCPQRSGFTHYYFYIRDERLGSMVMRIASFFPFQTTYYLLGRSFMERELLRSRTGFKKQAHAFLAVDDIAALQTAADRLSPELIRERLAYWTFHLGLMFSAREREQISLLSLLRHRPYRVLPQFHLQAPFSHP